MDYISAFLSPLLGGFRKGYNTEHVLLNFLQTCKVSLDKKGSSWSNTYGPF